MLSAHRNKPLVVALALGVGMLLSLSGLGGVAAGKAAAAGVRLAAGAGGSKCVSQAQAFATQAKAPEAFNPPSRPVDMSKIRGADVWIISVDQADSFDAEETSGAVAAAAAAGLKSTVFDGQGQTTLFNQGVSEAVAAHASGIILEGIDPHLVSGPLAQAKAAGIPAVDTFNGPPGQALETGIVAHVPANYALGGKEVAAWILGNSKCDADTLVFNAPVFSILKSTMQGFSAEYKKLCPQCKLTVRNIDLPTLATELPSGTSESLRADPSINYIFGTFDAMIPDILPAVQQSGSKAKIVGHDGLPANLQWIRQGLQAADVALPPIQILGWAGVDLIGRALLHQPLTPYVMPGRIVDKKNIPSTDAAVFPAFAHYQTVYKHIWGVH